ncbi:hypothetical protein A3D00_01730 [Candidatus Woesebacteria bacterium RIFCSPHIGHO2_02_FULL_38_9]|uniref:Uncharacterized protein n=1 Tax=Candidatus Woesebacteria bacterium RIFCSPHIGHO2_01_FULL_39_28 TaxID=1802496 RepID=A0A1F7YFM7_9BACT|nr:MAG: hypothetical protein A2627_03720 [Candidatus Woesebacteria bacterium RIFCSPHIGHO2_01_FULL_39_28]OGM33648.1 MAG: hypothetical protein A3D00_01730 [Candidatus Woesebacteria bacterium RIFCSPHIGHO2_02_FULL_38_9]OGM58531.1 MAG: hypothetical protein A3A50_00730 [Candidatus Woesebacteria bacterium RIFCSPLOWO2_01_FULL_38_20]
MAADIDPDARRNFLRGVAVGAVTAGPLGAALDKLSQQPQQDKKGGYLHETLTPLIIDTS